MSDDAGEDSGKKPPKSFHSVFLFLSLLVLIYLSKFLNVLAQIAKCICQNCKMYLSKLQNVFVK